MPWFRVGGIMVHLKLSGKAKGTKPCCVPVDIYGPRQACQQFGEYLCDWETGEGTTCDKPLCAVHAEQIGPDRHLCPEHAAKRDQRAPGLF